ncbi:unnamed protein product, partial [Cyprideis torosa]
MPLIGNNLLLPSYATVFYPPHKPSPVQTPRNRIDEPNKGFHPGNVRRPESKRSPMYTVFFKDPRKDIKGSGLTVPAYNPPPTKKAAVRPTPSPAVTGLSKSRPNFDSHSTISSASWAKPNRIDPHDNYIHYQDPVKNTYQFGYRVDDPWTEDNKFHHETRREDGTVQGAYGVVEPDGNVRIVYYISDKDGY